MVERVLSRYKAVDLIHSAHTRTGGERKEEEEEEERKKERGSRGRRKRRLSLLTKTKAQREGRDTSMLRRASETEDPPSHCLTDGQKVRALRIIINLQLGTLLQVVFIQNVVCATCSALT